MPIPRYIRESRLLRWPLLAMSHAVFSLLRKGPAVLRRATYDAMPVPYIVTGHPEQFVVETRDRGTGRMLFLTGEQDFWKLEVALAILESEKHPVPTHLIDVGANIGTIVIPAIKRGLFTTATAIEPHPSNIRLLRTNLALNGLDDRVTVLNQAVGRESDGQLFLHEVEDDSSTHAIGTEGIPVRSIRLDDLDFPSQSLLWMDIEGYEGHALDGAKSLLSSGVPLVAEFHPEFLAQSGGLQAFLHALENRRIFDLQSPHRKETTIDAINQRLAEKPKHLQWTDVLAIA